MKLWWYKQPQVWWLHVTEQSPQQVLEQIPIPEVQLEDAALQIPDCRKFLGPLMLGEMALCPAGGVLSWRNWVPNGIVTRGSERSVQQHKNEREIDTYRTYL